MNRCLFSNLSNSIYDNFKSYDPKQNLNKQTPVSNNFIHKHYTKVYQSFIKIPSYIEMSAAISVQFSHHRQS